MTSCMHVEMRIYNKDGGEVGACGNASRCVTALVLAQVPATHSVIIHTRYEIALF